NCVVQGNWGYEAGGIGGNGRGMVFTSWITNNVTPGDGGGAMECELHHCVISDNHASWNGGGLCGARAYWCRIEKNRAGNLGGGLESGTAENCELIGNTGEEGGGGAFGAHLANCFIYANTADEGGGAMGALLQNCTVVGNTAVTAGGVLDGLVENCIVYYNTAMEAADYLGLPANLRFSCVPVDPGGVSNITADPGLTSVGSPRLAALSPCVDAGDNGVVSNGWEDIEGHTRIVGGTVDMGCYEYDAANMTGALQVEVVASHTQVVLGAAVDLRPLIEGYAMDYRWDLGDGATPANEFVQHTYASSGVFHISLSASNLTGGGASTVSVAVLDEYICYVSDNGSATYPYTSWATAARDIQSAIEAAAQVPMAEVLVSNGVYSTGWVKVFGDNKNRISISNNVAVRSVNGAAVTVIEGAGPIGADAVRCAVLGAGAVLEGFTITNGHTLVYGDDNNVAMSGGGLWCEGSARIRDCVITGCRASFNGGGSYRGVFEDCEFIGNYAENEGGGVYNGQQARCYYTKNYGNQGAGISEGTAEDCVFEDNQGYSSAGGAFSAGITNCLVVGNSAEQGAGVDACRASGCRILDNIGDYGGGANAGHLYNCLLSGNIASHQGGGAWESRLYNCTVVGNEAPIGGGSFDCEMHNCIVYYNGDHYGEHNCFVDDETNITYTCTVPNPGGAGNITNKPGLQGLLNPRLVSCSPCRDAGDTNFAFGVDIDGHARISGAGVDMGCSEFDAAYATGTLSVVAGIEQSKIVLGTPVLMQPIIVGYALGYAWDLGDGTVITNEFPAQYTFPSSGVFAIELEVVNADGGVTVTVQVEVVDNYITYADVNATNPVYPYTSWATAATGIQEAVFAADDYAGAMVMVNDGVYSEGTYVPDGHDMRNRVMLTNSITVRSLNGPEATVIRGAGELGSYSAVRCVFMTHGAVLDGFTLEQGATLESTTWAPDCRGAGALIWYNGTITNCLIRNNHAELGGGVYCSFGGNVHFSRIVSNTAWSGGGLAIVNVGEVLNCLISENSAGAGGGVSIDTGGVLANCHILHNSAEYGGGALMDFGGTLRNCTVVGNTAAAQGGGTFMTDGGSVENSIVYYNTALSGANWHFEYGGDYTWCCTTPDPYFDHIITNEPGLAAIGNPFLVADSPCIDAGSNALSQGVAYGGDPRIAGGRVDIGCTEFDAARWIGALDMAVDVPALCVTGSVVHFKPVIQGRVLQYRWQWPDGSYTTNRLDDTFVFTNVGPNLLTLWASNTAGEVGLIYRIDAEERYDCYVNQASVAPAYPYTSWADAATNIQDAVDVAAQVPGAVVWVTNGVYSTGHRSFGGLRNRLVVSNQVIVKSVNGSLHTEIKGEGPAGIAEPMRGVFLGSGARLEGFMVTDGGTMTNGAYLTKNTGGGIFCMDKTCLVSNCVLVGNSAVEGGGIYNGSMASCMLLENSALAGGGASSVRADHCMFMQNSAEDGGGAAWQIEGDKCAFMANHSLDMAGAVCWGTLSNCYFVRNSSESSAGGAAYGAYYNCIFLCNTGWIGGGVFFASIDNCTVVDNTAMYQGGGLSDVDALNSIIYGNSAVSGHDNYDGDCTLDHCCATPLAAGDGNIDDDPAFVDEAEENYALSSASPCIDAGTNQPWMVGAPDHTGNPRIMNGIVDMGYAEYYSFTVGEVPHYYTTAGGDVSSAITATPGYPWTATTDQRWISLVVSGASNATGLVLMMVETNDSPAGRTATVRIGDQVWTIVQAGAGDNARMLGSTDFDRDLKADLAVFEFTSGTWYILQSSDETVWQQQWGWLGPVPAVGDYDHDGKADIAVHSVGDGGWYARLSDTATLRYTQWGWSRALSVQGDYDGDRQTDVAVYSLDDGAWYIQRSSDTSLVQQVWGWSDSVPVPGDYDGDGLTDIAVYWPEGGMWYVLRSSDGIPEIQHWGWAAAKPVPGDYDGDGLTDMGVYSIEDGMWYVLLSSSMTTMEAQWGWRNAMAVPADYDGDGRTDLTVFNQEDGMWYIRGSSGLYIEQQFGWQMTTPTLPQFLINRWFP
ncbi:MAG: PKD domain-containing protein, partial [Spartobacteria bacterium]|nr:PKD domain-containing protein [Spartobacteria bacterium]